MAGRWPSTLAAFTGRVLQGAVLELPPGAVTKYLLVNGYWGRFQVNYDLAS
jgi:hypothetical protein